MREIKFRIIVRAKIADIEFHTFEYSFSRLIEKTNNNEGDEDALSCLISEYLEDIEADYCSCSFNETQNFCECERGEWGGGFEIIDILQFIGLKDNYGTEIYKGDIVKSLEDENNFVGVVEYEQDRYYIKGETDNYCFQDFILDDYKTNLLIIGNIYENPELLKGENNEFIK